MPLFRCLIRGENFPGALIGSEEPIGFYTTRFVEAGSPEEAEMLAIGLLRDDANLDVPPEHASVYFEEIEEVPERTEQLPDKGFSFFPMSA